MAVLIIDDSKLMRYQVRQMLPEQLEIVEAADGEEGFNRILELKPKLIILDCFMPKMNGWQVVNRMLAYPELSPIPVVLMTGRKDEIEDNAPNLFDYFVYDYFELMSKPFDREGLVEAIKKAVIKAKKRTLEAPVSPVSPAPAASSPVAMPVMSASPASAMATQAPLSQVLPQTALPNSNASSSPAAATLFPSGLNQVSFSPAAILNPPRTKLPSQPVPRQDHAPSPVPASPQQSAAPEQPNALNQLQTLQNEVETLRQQNASFHREIQALKAQVTQILQET